MSKKGKLFAAPGLWHTTHGTFELGIQNGDAYIRDIDAHQERYNELYFPNGGKISVRLSDKIPDQPICAYYSNSLKKTGFRHIDPRYFVAKQDCFLNDPVTQTTLLIQETFLSDDFDTDGIHAICETLDDLKQVHPEIAEDFDEIKEKLREGRATSMFQHLKSLCRLKEPRANPPQDPPSPA